MLRQDKFKLKIWSQYRRKTKVWQTDRLPDKWGENLESPLQAVGDNHASHE